jgi:hypothetical protein
MPQSSEPLLLAFTTGNEAFPLVDFGRCLYLMKYLLDNSTMTLGAFFEARFSEDQVGKLADKVNKLHQAYKVDAEFGSQDPPKKNWLQNFWYGSGRLHTITR